MPRDAYVGPVSCRLISTLLLVSATLTSVFAQQPSALPGVSEPGAEFNPANVRVYAFAPENTGATVVYHPPTISPSEYARKKNSKLDAASGSTASIASTQSAVVPGQGLAQQASLGFEALPATPSIPPSANAAAGPKEVIEVMNQQLGRFDKNTGAQIGTTIPASTWFQNLLSVTCPSGISTNCPIVDPQVRYDQIHGHFLITAQTRDISVHTSYLLLSVSNGATWDSGWMNWALDGSLDGTTKTQNWADFPQVGYDDKAVYIAPLMFDWTNTFQYPKLRIINKSDLYAFPATLSFKDSINFYHADGRVASTLQPVVVRGRLGVGPPGHIIVAASDEPGATFYTVWTIDDPTLPNPTFTRSTIQNVWAYNHPANAPQYGSPYTLDPGQTSILKAVYREGFIYTAQNVELSDQPTTVLYNRIDATSKQATLQSRPVNGDYFYPAFDVPASLGPGNAVPPVIAGTTTAPDGSLTYAGILNTKAGEAPYNINNGNLTARWGDYFGGAVDPVTGGLWVSGEYAKAWQNGSSLYGTWISYFPWSTVPQFSDVSSSSYSYDFVNVLAAWGVTKGCGATTFCPADPVTREQMAAFLVRSIWGENFTYTQQPYFTDVPASDPLFKYVQKLRDAGFTNGCSATSFCPFLAVTREEAAAFIIRAKMNPLFGSNFTYPPNQMFNDVAPGDLFFQYVQKMAELGYTSGCAAPPNAMYCATSPVSREQAAVFLVRAFLN